MFLELDKRGEVATDDVIKWIGYLSLLAVAILAVWRIILSMAV